MPRLNWLTREADLQKSRRAPYRLLEPVPEPGYGDSTTGNLLITAPGATCPASRRIRLALRHVKEALSRVSGK